MSQDRTPAEEEIAKSLRLRGASPPVARLSRRALVVSGAALSLALFAALGWSLSERRRPPPPAADPSPASAPSERVTALPRGYVGPAGVPALGPPLPGDLGRPMLAAQQRGKTVDWPSGEPAPTIGTPPAMPPQRPAADLERETRVAARQAARQSDLFATARPDGRGGSAAPSAAAPGTAAPAIDARTTSGERLQAPASPYVLQAGAVIPAALVTGLRSDAPGVAVAQVTQDVHDSLGGGVLLIPAGSRLIGEYGAEVKAGDSRLQVTWTRLILPSGRSIVLDKLPATDAQGMAGLQDGVDHHGGRILAAAGLSTLLAIGAESGASADESDLVRAIRRGGADAVTDVGRQVVGRSLDRVPTLTIRPGAPLRVLLTKDLVLEPYVERTSR